LTAELIAFIEKKNPQFKERHVESSKPGELLNQDTFLVGSFIGVGRVYIHVVVDTWCSYAFGFMHVSKQAEAAVALLYNDFLSFYHKHKLSVVNILTDNGRKFCGTEQHPYELYPELNDIKHRRTKVRNPQTNGFVERFNRTILDEFLRVMLREKVYTSIESLQTDFDQWFQFYNEQRPYLGYRNHGKKPMELILDFNKFVQ
jgi:transposase InsO family protein